MRQREEIIKLLYKILTKSYEDGKAYMHISETNKRLLFKIFFSKLSHQKRSFCKRILYEIQVLEHELAVMGRKVPLVTNWKKNIDPILPVFRIEKDGLIKDSYRREKENIGIYQNLLSKISLGHIREMLMFQKHSVQLILNEIESMGLKITEENGGKLENGINLGDKRKK